MARRRSAVSGHVHVACFVSAMLTWEGEDGEHGRPVPMGLLVKPHVSADPYLVLNHVFSDGRRRRFHSLVLVLVLYSHTLKSEF